MLYGSDVEGMAVIMKPKTVIANAESELGRLDVLKPLHVTLACGGEVGQSMKNTQRCGLFDGAELGLSLVSQVILLRSIVKVRDVAVQV